MDRLFTEIDNLNRDIVQHQTWGHLFPSDTGGAVHGAVRVSKSCYGDVTILENNIPVPGSPWEHASLWDYVTSISDEIPDGEVWEFFTECWVESHVASIHWLEDFHVNGVYDLEEVEIGQCIHFETIHKKVVLRGLK